MMSWKIPSLEYPPAPKEPRFILWLLLMIAIGAIGFGLGVYLSANEMLPETMSSTMIIVVFVVLPALFIPVIRFFIYSLAAYRHQLFTEMLDDARQEWCDWARKHLGLLAHSRLTQIDEENKEGVILSSLMPNRDNVLTLNALKSLPLWDKQEKNIQALLAPIAAYYHQHGLTQAITFYVQTEKSDTDFLVSIQDEARRLSINIESVEPLPQASLSEWLLALYDQPFELKLYGILSCSLEDTSVSEEASCLLLAPQELYEKLHVPAKSKLLRPISTDLNDFPNALATQCEFQLEGTQLNAVWHSGVTDSDKGKCVESYSLQGIQYLPERLYDADSFLGKTGQARHGCTLSCE